MEETQENDSAHVQPENLEHVHRGFLGTVGDFRGLFEEGDRKRYRHIRLFRQVHAGYRLR